MQGSHAWRADNAVFDEENLVSHAGAASTVTEAINTAVTAGATTANTLVRADSATMFHPGFDGGEL